MDKKFKLIVLAFVVAFSPLFMVAMSEVAHADPAINEYALSDSGNQHPQNIVSGPDGNLWFTEQYGNAIGEMTTSGTLLNEYELPNANSDPFDIIAGPDGALWFTEFAGGRIGRITTGGVVTEYSMPFPYSTGGEFDIAVGSDGALWFTESGYGTYIGRIDASGDMSFFDTNTGSVAPTYMTAGPDGSLWFSETGANEIGNINPNTYAITQYPLPAGFEQPDSLTLGSDGNIWFGCQGNNYTESYVGELSTQTGAIQEFPIFGNSQIGGITAGSDGALWATNDPQSEIARISTSGDVTSYGMPANDGRLRGDTGITDGPDGNLWFAEASTNEIGQVVIAASQTPAAPANLTLASPTDHYPSLTWSSVSGASSYNIYRDGNLVGNATNVSFSDDSVTSDGTYVYTVTTVDSSDNESGPSIPVSVVYDTTAPVLGAPSWEANPVTAGQSTSLTLPATDNLSGVEGGEYYIGNTDPGVGNGTPMSYDGSNIDATLGSNLAPGTYPVNVRAEDAAGNWSGVTTTSLVVNPAGTSPAFTSPSSAIAGTGAPFNFIVSTIGSPVPVLSYAGNLPAGLTFTDNGDGTATIGGTLTGGQGTYLLAITAANSVGSATQDFVLYVNPVTITSVASDTESFGVPFSFTVTTTGNPAPSVSKTGALPPGVTFTSNGDGTATIAGTPDGRASGPYTLNLTAKNSLGTATQTFVLGISKAPVLKNITNKTTSVGSAFSMNVTVSSSVTPGLTASALPAGLSFTDNGNGSGSLFGTPQVGTGGEYYVTITATNSLGTDTKTFTLKVKEGPAITSSSAASASVGSAFSFQVTATGYPAPSISRTGSLPSGIRFHASTGTFSGTAASGSVGTYPITIAAKNSTGTVTQNFVLTVN